HGPDSPRLHAAHAAACVPGAVLVLSPGRRPPPVPAVASLCWPWAPAWRPRPASGCSCPVARGHHPRTRPGRDSACPAPPAGVRSCPPPGGPPMTPRRRALLLAFAALGACAASARLLAGRVDVGGMEVAWVSWQNRLRDVRKARRTLAELEQKHG